MNTISRPRHIKFRRASLLRGMSLIETMVGMVIGILVTLIITQVWGNFESQKQRTVSVTSAQTSGLLALTELEQDIRNAGAGLTDSAAFDCTQTYSYYETGGTSVSPIPAYAGSLAMMPVQITDGGTGSDTLTVKRSGDFLGALPTTISPAMPSPSSIFKVSSTTGFTIDPVNDNNNLVLAVDSTTGKCSVMLLTNVSTSSFMLQHNPGGSTTYNPPASFQNTNAWPGYSDGAKLMKIGQLVSHAYTVNASNQLELTDYSVPSVPPATAPISILATDIVKIKAQYGIANTGSQNVNAWVNATAATGWDTLDSAKVKRIKAIRLVIVARSAKLEGADVTIPCTNPLSGGVNNGPCAWSDTVADPAPLIDLSSNSDWKKYRYRVYQSIIPIRNVIWAGV